MARLGELYGEFAPSQLGFVRGRSVETAWPSVEDTVASSGATYVLGVFVDLRGAWSGAVSWENRRTAVWWDYFNDRRVCVEV